LPALARGITGNAQPWNDACDHPLRPLQATLADMPAHVQERWFARLWLIKPVILGCLSIFWLVSGIVGLIRQDDAADFLALRGVPANVAHVSVLAGSAADILVGAAVLVRPLARPALLAMIAITLFYLAASTLLAPDLWLAPLRPLVKTIPALCLVLVALAVLDER
jgi:hypothetical protein